MCIMKSNLIEEKVLAPYCYISELPGKNLRQKLANAFDFWLQIPIEKMMEILNIIQIIDDIEDNSCLRRGQPVAHLIYGQPLTINAANTIYFLALQKVLELNHPKAVEIFTSELIELHKGQGLDIYWRDSHNCPSENQYFDMVAKKTGGLFRLAFKLMALYSKREFNQSKYIDLLNDLSIYFQINDDYANLISSKYHENKSFCEDLSEGKYSYPIIHMLRQTSNSNNDKSHQKDLIQNVLKQRTTDQTVKAYCLQILKDNGTFTHTLAILNEYEDRIKAQIEELGGNDQLLDILQSLKHLRAS